MYKTLSIFLVLIIIAGCKTSSTLSFDVKESASPKNHIGVAPSISFKMSFEQKEQKEQKSSTKEK